MDTILAKIRELIESPMQEMDIVVDSVVWETENKLNTLRIVLDRVNGLDIDAIVEATNVINPILDEYDLIDQEYVLDICRKERG